MSTKHAKIAALLERFPAGGLDPHYLAYFDCFNRQLFYEAHDVLEALWLPERKGAKGDFYKGLIQLAGAFVHLQKHRLQPAAALFKLAHVNLSRYPGTHDQLEVDTGLALARDWLRRLEETQFKVNPLGPGKPPQLELRGDEPE